MNSKTNWTILNKLSFRFIFIFFILEIFTESFVGNLFTNSSLFYEIGGKVFLSPLLWLNNHFFHFPYFPNDWNPISGSLILIRHIVYLLFSISASIFWTLFDSKTSNYNKLNFWFSEFLKIALSLKVFGYGIIKVFPIQMNAPNFLDLHKIVGDLSPVDLLWTAIGYGQPYQIFLGIAEVNVAILILFRKTMVVGLLLLLPILANVVMMNYTYVIGVLDLTFLLLIINIYLLIPFASSFYLFFINGKSAVLNYDYFNISYKRLKYAVAIFGILIVVLSFSLRTITTYKLYKKLKFIDASRKYSEIKSYVSEKDTLKPTLGDSISWRFWSEKIINQKYLVTIITNDSNKSYSFELEKDTINHILTLNSLTNTTSKPIKLKYSDIDNKNWRIEGELNGKNISVDLKKIIPEENLNLLKTKRNFLNLD